MPNKDNNYSSYATCDNLVDFVGHIKDICSNSGRMAIVSFFNIPWKTNLYILQVILIQIQEKKK